jgi:hypothetical protein
MYAEQWKVIATDPKDSKMEADIESISFKEDEQFFYIKLVSHTNWNLYNQKGSLFMYFDIYCNYNARMSTAILTITEYEMDKYAVGFFDMMTNKVTQCENDFKHFSEIGSVKISRDALLNKFYKFSFLCVLGNSYYGDFVSYDLCPDSGSMMKYQSKFCPDKPILVVTKSLFDFGSIKKNSILDGKFQIFNCGTKTLNVRIENSKKYITIDPPKLSLDEFKFDTIRFNLDTSGLEPNIYEEKITINSNGGTQDIKVTFEVLKDPELYCEPEVIDFGISPIGDKIVKTIKIGNKNKGPIKVRLVSTVDWLVISKNSFEGDFEDIRLTAITKNLTQGEHTGQLKILSNGGNAEIPLKISTVNPFTLNREIVDFGKVYSDNLSIEPINVVIKNNIDRNILMNIEVGASWIKLSENNFELQSNGEHKLEISVDFSQFKNNETYSSKIIFKPVDLEFNAELKVQVEFLEAQPKIFVTIEGNVESIEGEITVGEKFERKIIIKNIGGSILKGKAYFSEENSPFKLSGINFIIKSSQETELTIYLDSSNLQPGIIKNTLILDSNGGKIELPLSIKVNPKPPIVITLKIGSSEAYVGGEIIILDAPPYIKKGTTFVPIRFISEVFGAKVEWQNIGKGRVIIKLKDKEIILDIDKTTAFINKKPYTLLAPPEIVNGRTFVPVRFISEGLGAEVKWIAQTQEVIISMNQ